ncbi:type VI secretion system baseplate subunit TssE [Kangiella sp.]|uniref:type VI secretion system baseplate subunit TssE n=1 Tax=Kangiella sp. TaxID=1920245 RepID=UPI0019C58AC0|nr:type VI secretion system baseplate subunit TssE [Kangiella sp.]MBD3654742.1 type VI secretion system baseplate subunit TssE [Kangiella sp.]
MESLWERLTGKEITSEQDWLAKSICEDLKRMLNTRKSLLLTGEQFPNAKRSILNYGINDFNFGSVGTEEERKELANQIHQVIREYEPRIENMIIEILENKNKEDRVLRLDIKAELKTKEQINIRTNIDVMENASEIKELYHE